jgi:hypothetical protein
MDNSNRGFRGSGGFGGSRYSRLRKILGTLALFAVLVLCPLLLQFYLLFSLHLTENEVLNIVLGVEESPPHFKGLRALVMGLEHSCTTMIASLLFNAPCVIGAFETGYLLAQSPKDITEVQPWYAWNNERGIEDLTYRLTPEDSNAMKGAPNFQTMYDILRERSYIFNDLIDEEYCEKPYQMIDKTPRYILKQHFENVIDKTPGVPIIVAQKSFDKLKESWAKRNQNLSRKLYDTTFNNAWQMKQKHPHRILIVQEEDFMKDPNAVMEDVFHHVGLEWRSEYLKMEGLLKKVSNSSALTEYVNRLKFQAGKHSDFHLHKA